MGKGSGVSDAGVTAAQSSANAANTAYGYGDKQWTYANNTLAKNDPLINQIVQGDISAQGTQNQLGQANASAYESGVLPMAGQYFDQVKNYDTPAQEALNAGAAESGVATAMEGQRNAAMQQLEGFGVDPTSTRYASLDIGSRAQQGAAMAGAGTSAIQSTKMQGMALENAALGAGLGLSGAASGASNAGTNAGAGGAGAATGQENAATNALSGGAQWYNSGASNMGQYVNAVNGFNYANNQANATSMQGMSGLGEMAGSIMSLAKFADGGPVLESMAMGIPEPQGRTPAGGVPAQASPSGGQAIDDVPARLTAGEFVVPKDVVSWYGQQHLVAMLDKARKGQQQLAGRQDIGGQAIPMGPGGQPQRAPQQAPQQAPPAYQPRGPMAQGIPTGPTR